MNFKLIREEYTEKTVTDFNKYDEKITSFHKITKEEYFYITSNEALILSTMFGTEMDYFTHKNKNYLVDVTIFKRHYVEYPDKNKKNEVKWSLCNSGLQDIKNVIDESYFKISGVPINIEYLNKIYNKYLRELKLKRIVNKIS